MMPLAMMALGMGAKALVGAARKPKVGMLDPRKYKNMMMMSDASIGSFRNAAADTTARMNMANTAAIRQAGAAGGAPIGATMSALSGSAYNAGRGAAAIEPQLAQMQQQGRMNYYNQLQAYEGAQANTYNQQTNDMMGDIGNMTKIAMLWQSGYFDKPEDFAGNPMQQRVTQNRALLA
jgi:hypothetical protein